MRNTNILKIVTTIGTVMVLICTVILAIYSWVVFLASLLPLSYLIVLLVIQIGSYDEIIKENEKLHREIDIEKGKRSSLNNEIIRLKEQVKGLNQVVYELKDSLKITGYIEEIPVDSEYEETKSVNPEEIKAVESKESSIFDNDTVRENDVLLVGRIITINNQSYNMCSAKKLEYKDYVISFVINNKVFKILQKPDSDLYQRLSSLVSTENQTK